MAHYYISGYPPHLSGCLPAPGSPLPDCEHPPQWVVGPWECALSMGVGPWLLLSEMAELGASSKRPWLGRREPPRAALAENSAWPCGPSLNSGWARMCELWRGRGGLGCVNRPSLGSPVVALPAPAQLGVCVSEALGWQPGCSNGWELSEASAGEALGSHRTIPEKGFPHPISRGIGGGGGEAGFCA